jgi:hypothetical protein
VCGSSTAHKFNWVAVMTDQFLRVVPTLSAEGVSPKLLNFKTLDELQDMEAELWEELREANEELRVARQYAIEFDDDEESLIATGLELKNSDDGVMEESGEIVIPRTTTEVFSSSKKGGLRNCCTATSSSDQWGA